MLPSCFDFNFRITSEPRRKIKTNCAQEESLLPLAMNYLIFPLMFAVKHIIAIIYSALFPVSISLGMNTKILNFKHSKH